MATERRQPVTLDELLRKALDLVEALKARSVLIGGLAVGIVGEARVTQDVDLILAFPVRKLSTLASRAKAAGFTVAGSSLDEAKATGALRLGWRGLHVDLILASTKFEESVFARSSTVTLLGRHLCVPTPEDLILLKLVPGREKDLLDAKTVIIRHRDRLNRSYLERWAQKLSDEAEDSRIWQTLQRLLREAHEQGR